MILPGSSPADPFEAIGSVANRIGTTVLRVVSPETPDIPEPPPPPSPGDPEVEEAQRRAAARERRRAGRASTILTGPRGVLGEAPVARPQARAARLLGE